MAHGLVYVLHNFIIVEYDTIRTGIYKLQNTEETIEWQAHVLPVRKLIHRHSNPKGKGKAVPLQA